MNNQLFILAVKWNTGHVIEKTGYTFDNNHKFYTGSWMYEYPVSGDKASYNSQNFSECLLASLKEAKLNEVILVGIAMAV